MKFDHVPLIVHLVFDTIILFCHLVCYHELICQLMLHKFGCL